MYAYEHDAEQTMPSTANVDEDERKKRSSSSSRILNVIRRGQQNGNKRIHAGEKHRQTPLLFSTTTTTKVHFNAFYSHH